MFKKYCQALVESFYNPRVYRDAITSWQGFGGAYLALVSAVMALIVTLGFFAALRTFEETQLNHLLDQMPRITISNGLISVDQETPVVIKTNDDPPLVITIDPNQSESQLRDTGTHVGIGETFFFVNVRGQYEVVYTDKLSDTNISIDKDSLRTMWNNNIPSIKVISYPLLWMGQFMNLVVVCVIVAFLSYFVTTFLREEYIFLTRMRLAALAVTPASLISTVLKMTVAHQTAPWFTLLLATLYLYVMLILINKSPAYQEDKIIQG